MKKSTIVILIISLCMLISGVVICAGVAFMADFDFNGLSSVTYRESVTTIDEAFCNLDVKGQSADIDLFVSSADECRVESSETDKMYHEVKVEGDTLVIRRVDERKWYEYIGINIDFKPESIKVYLPEGTYNEIVLKSTSGSVVVNEGIECKNLKATSTSGAVRVYGACVENSMCVSSTSGQVVADGVSSQSLLVTATSGRVNVSNIKQINDININATSGKIEATDIECESFNAENVSGGVICSGVVAEEDLCANTTSGSIQVLGCDGETLTLKSTSGSIRGTLLSEKIFITNTVSGSIKVPASSGGGVCNAETTSGSINITVE